MKQHIKTHRIELLADHKSGHTILSTESEMLAAPKIGFVNPEKESRISLSNQEVN